TFGELTDLPRPAEAKVPLHLLIGVAPPPSWRGNAHASNCCALLACVHADRSTQPPALWNISMNDVFTTDLPVRGFLGIQLKRHDLQMGPGMCELTGGGEPELSGRSLQVEYPGLRIGNKLLDSLPANEAEILHPYLRKSPLTKESE